jgi:molybdate transport system substrate-binding protein
MRTILLLFLITTLLGSVAPAQDITVAAASDLNYALKDLASRFEKKNGDKVTLSFGSSGNLYSQIQGGAPYDLFFSADMEYPRKLASAGLVESSSLRAYAVGHLVLWVPNGSNLDPQELKMDLLLEPSVKRIAIANPQHAPYGRAAMAALESLGVKQKVTGKLVFGENVSQAAQFVQSGNAQAGLIPLSLAMSPAMKNAGRYWQLPANTYPEMQQGVAILSSSRQKRTAQAFIDYISLSEGATILEQYGFRVPASK